ncbi:unnamed protein product [Rotaria socialis]|uniref:Berberine/berberine-like domain-containing protein n=2 Tax=Rotaria socialis TaxID=392032 RepID=A0A818RNE0_9BILA|nr:unnamed protein product [Rotaria socialis]
MFLFIIVVLSQYYAVTGSICRCLSNDSTSWQLLNDSINGCLVLPRPSAASCTLDQFNMEACAIAYTNWINSKWRSEQLGAVQYYNFIKTTGHDILGRSTAPGSFLLRLHYMKNMPLIPQYSSCGSANVTNEVRLGAAISGSCNSVGDTGGFLQGGGHSLLPLWKGLDVDQVLEYGVVTADGQRKIVSPCQNSDLFYALSGGAGGTHDVVLSVVLRTFSSPYIISILLSIEASNETRYVTLIRDFVPFLPKLADDGCAGYISMGDHKISMKYIWPNGELNIGNATFSEFQNNNTDLVFSAKTTAFIPSFYEAYKLALTPSDPNRYNMLLGSRLIPDTVVRYRPDDQAKLFLQMKHISTKATSLLISHVVYGQDWADNTSMETQKLIAADITSRIQILDTLSNNALFDSDLNEADPNEPNWKQRYFGSQAMYDRLKSIKQVVDPQGLFICKHWVGSDDWTSDLNCPILSISIKLSLTWSFILMEFFILKTSV